MALLDRRAPLERSGSALPALVALSAVAALLAGTIDPYVIKPAVPTLPLPRRWPLEALQYLVFALSAFLLFGSRITTIWTRRAVAAVLSLVSPALFLLATPFTRPGTHALSAAHNLAILVLSPRSHARSRRSTRGLLGIPARC